MRLYFHPFSSNARRAVMTAYALNAPVELKLVELPKGEHHSPEFLAKNPNGVVPVLEDGDFVLWESCAIMQYLADITPGQTLYPQAAQARADVNRWLFWSAHHWSPTIGVFTWERVIKPMIQPGSTPDAKELEEAETELTKLAKVLDAHLSKHPWLANDAYSLADLAVASPLMYMNMAQVPLQTYAHIQAWFERIKTMDAWKKTSEGLPV